MKHFNIDEIKFNEVIGKGENGVVTSGTYENINVAIKHFKNYKENINTILILYKELVIYQYLKDSKYVPKIYGTILHDNNLYLIIEQFGKTLYNYITTNEALEHLPTNEALKPLPSNETLETLEPLPLHLLSNETSETLEPLPLPSNEALEPLHLPLPLSLPLPSNETLEPLPSSLPLHLSIKKIFKNILLAVKDIHSHGIFHSDLKPSNILIDEDLNIKIIDFGLSDYLGISPTIEILSGYLCTDGYKSNDERKSYQSDSYSIGQIFCNIIGSTYFDYLNEDFINLKGGKYCYELIIDLLNSDIHKRLTPLEALNHKYFNDVLYDDFKYIEFKESLYSTEVNTINRNYKYSKNEFLNKSYELKYNKQIIKYIGDLNIELNDIREGNNTEKLNEIYDLQESDDGNFSENNKINTLLTYRNNFIDKDPNFRYTLNTVYDTLDKFDYVYAYNSYKEFYEVIVYNPKLNYYPIWTIVEYIAIINEYEYNIIIDKNKYYNIICAFIICTKNKYTINIWELCNSINSSSIHDKYNDLIDEIINNNININKYLKNIIMSL